MALACSDADSGAAAAGDLAPTAPPSSSPGGASNVAGSSDDEMAAAPGSDAPAAADTGDEGPGNLPLNPSGAGPSGTSGTPPADPTGEMGSTPTPPNTPPDPPPASDGPLPFVFDRENTGADCAAGPLQPAFGALARTANLPDPFLLFDGTRMTRRDQWRCRRSEIGSLIEFWGSGPKGAPPSNLSATLSGNTLTVVVTENGASLTLTSTITKPAGPGPFPLVIGMNTPTGSLPGNLFDGVATMAFNAAQLVPNSFNVPRGGGAYFDMYPDTNTGAMIEWAWGVSRLIDGLYMTADQNGIDLKHIGVTGCSFQGKMALYAGAFDERIALVIPEESGGGGEASWRFMATQTGTEDLEAAQGTAWYAQNLLQFRNADAPKLPFDMHELVALVAPRAILAIHNTGIDRLGSQAASVSMRAAAEVYEALGIPDRIGFSQTNAPAHCSFPGSQAPEVQAFVSKFLRGDSSANTSVAKDAYNTDLTPWVTWSTPELE
ncbi:MAG TPA: hypothetical protein VMG12_03685 [Polyangiaceae bacterium]|nr:hypothetical protein [Polyangiaceae bacterium]